LRASCSRGEKRDVQELGWRLAILQTLRDHTEGEGLNLGDCLVAIMAIAEDPRKGRDFGDPPTVGFALEVDGEDHTSNLHLAWPPNKRLQPTARGGILSAPRLNRGREAPENGPAGGTDTKSSKAGT
jgi:hypothetical protein